MVFVIILDFDLFWCFLAVIKDEIKRRGDEGGEADLLQRQDIMDLHYRWFERGEVWVLGGEGEGGGRLHGDSEILLQRQPFP